MASLKGIQQRDTLLSPPPPARRIVSLQCQAGRLSLEMVVAPSSPYTYSYHPTQPPMGKMICVDLPSKRFGGRSVDFPHTNRPVEVVGRRTCAGCQMAKGVDVQHHRSRSAQRCLAPVLRQVVTGSRHGRGSGNVELRPFCSSQQATLSRRECHDTRPTDALASARQYWNHWRSLRRTFRKSASLRCEH